MLRLSMSLCAILVAGVAQAAPTLRVVTSTTDLAAITAAIGAAQVEVESICVGDQDPHYIQARPSFMRLLADADLFIRVGLELEKAWEIPLLRGSRNSKVQIGAAGHLDVSAGIQRLDVPAAGSDRSMGDVHLLGNPHYWLDPYNGRLIARTIAQRLAQLDPAHAGEYEENRRRFERLLDERMFGAPLVEELTGDLLWEHDNAGTLEMFLQERGKKTLLGGWRQRVEDLGPVAMVTFHLSWSYFARRFGIAVIAQLEPKPGIPPGPKHLISVIKRVHAKKARVILVEPYYDRKVADFVARKTGITVEVVANATGEDKSASGYLNMLDNVFRAIGAATGGQSG